jgi:hypothetical protein
MASVEAIKNIVYYTPGPTAGSQSGEPSPSISSEPVSPDSISASLSSRFSSGRIYVFTGLSSSGLTIASSGTGAYSPCPDLPLFSLTSISFVVGKTISVHVL